MSKGRPLGQSEIGDDFPCIICRKTLQRVYLDEGQPSEGVVCTTHGNYGSTKYDPMDGRYIAFNICDDCLVRLGEEGVLWETRAQRPIRAKVGKYSSIIGWQRVDRPYIQWHLDLPSDDDSIDIDVHDTYWDNRDGCTFNVELSILRAEDDRYHDALEKGEIEE